MRLGGTTHRVKTDIRRTSTLALYLTKLLLNENSGRVIDEMTTKTPGRLAAAAMFVAAVGCLTAYAGERVSAAELRRLVPGASLTGTVSGGDKFEGTYYKDGTMAIRTENDSDTGVWEFEEDTVCLTWRKWRDAKRYCISWEMTADGYLSRFADGRHSTTFKIVE